MNQEIEWRGGGQWWSFNEYLKADNFLTNYILILLSLGFELYSPDAELSKQRSRKRKFFRVCSIFIKTDEKINQKRRYLPNTHSDKGLKRNFCSIFLGHFIE